MTKTNNYTQSGERLTFHQLFDEKGYQIQIPIIQRDYAQGRPSTLEVRSLFLDAIKTYLDENVQNRDLDFVYGSLLDEKDENTKFIPLDGQQRLTTLFLLHWYLASKDNRVEELRSVLLEKKKSRFAYETRTSSTDFCDALLNNEINFDNLLGTQEGGKEELSSLIKDSNWYFLSWDNDPTIKSMLVMLDAIHRRFFSVDNYYERLVNKQHPIITFQFLNLKEFKLTDDLYIKMNARGKPLTSFENFKAKFEQLIHNTTYTTAPTYKLSYSGQERKVSVSEYFSNKIDTDWANLFWQHRNRSTNIFDDQLMNLFRALAATHLAAKLAPLDAIPRVRFLLDNKNAGITFNQFKQLSCFDENYIIELIDLLDMLKNGEDVVRCYLDNSTYYNELDTFTNIINNNYKDAAYTQRIQFYAFCQYLIHWKKDEGLDAWMRIIHNLSENTAPYNNENEFIRSIKSIKKLIPFSNSILESLDDDLEVEGFSPVQIEEEKVKAVLILKSSAWADLIYKTEEELQYFKGQITYLLSFAGILEYFKNNGNFEWDDNENDTFYDRFIFYANRSRQLFDNNGLMPFSEFSFQRALLAKGDYLLAEGSNRSFLIDSDRDISWKRLLLGDKRGDEHKALFVRDLMDDQAFDDTNVQYGLSQIASNSVTAITDWRKYFIEFPQCLNCLGQKKYIRFNSPQSVYLLSGQKKSGTYYEYYTYGLFWKFFSGNSFPPFTSVFYYSVSGEDEEPCMVLGKGIMGPASFELDVYFYSHLNQYRLRFFDGNQVPFDTKVAQILTKHNFALNGSGTIYESSVPESEVLQCVKALTADLQTIQL